MGEINKELFEHKFTHELDFRSSFDKIKCFRVMDEEGNIVNKHFEDQISADKLKDIFKCMVTINEADQIFNQAQRQSRISFYMTQLGEEASGVGSAAALQDHDLIFP